MTWRAITAAGLFLACSRTEELPPDLLPRDKFIDVLFEAQMIEARLNYESTVDKRTDMPVREYYADMFRREGVPEEAFKRTFDYYTLHPELLREAYNEVLARIQQHADSTGH